MLKQKQKISVFLIVCMICNCIFSASANADDVNKVTDLVKGQRAPFSGVLLSHDVAAKISADKQLQIEACDVKVDSTRKQCEAKAQLDLSIATTQLTAEKMRCSGLIKLKDNRIDELMKNYEPLPWYEGGKVTFVAGFVAGFAVFLGAGYVISRVSR